MKKKILFIINPKSGASNKEHFEEWIRKGLDESVYEAEITHTESPHHATQLSRKAASSGSDVVVAVGGDGSVNEVADGLMGTSATLGIIPTGSGNGLARHLNIPMNFEQAIQVLNKAKQDRMDTMRVNKFFCAGTFGVGFDAHIAHLFTKSKKRGYSTYVKLVLTEFYKYKIKNFEYEIDGTKYNKECFLLTFANSSQFGNNAVIAPFADVKDGIIEISIVRAFPLRAAPLLIYRMMKNSLNASKYFQGLKGESIILKNNRLLYGHIDGEPKEFNEDIRIEINPLSLNVIIP